MVIGRRPSRAGVTRVRRPMHAALGDDRGDERRRRDVERRVARREPRRHLGGVALLDRDVGLRRARRVERRRRRDDDERQPVVRCEHGEPIGADLVRGVAVRRDPVGARDDEIDVAAAHERGGRTVGDHRVRDAELLELPGGQARALEQRPRLADPDVRDATRLEGCADGAEGGSVASGREAACVAVREHARGCREQSTACAHIRRQRSTSSAWMRSARSRVGSSRIASSAQRRLTAVGRDAASVS